MFPEGGDLQEYVLAQVKTVPGRADQSGREQERAERAPIRAPTSAPARAHTCAPLAASGRIRGCVKRAGADRLARCDRRSGAPFSRTAATEGDICSFQRPPDHPHIADSGAAGSSSGPVSCDTHICAGCNPSWDQPMRAPSRVR